MKYSENYYQIKESIFKLTVKLIIKLNQIKNNKRFAAIYNQILDSVEKTNKYFSNNEIKLQNTYKLEIEYALDELHCIMMNIKLLKDNPKHDLYDLDMLINDVQSIYDTIRAYKNNMKKKPENCIS